MEAAAPQYILLVDDDRTLAEGLALALERNGRTVIVCHDLESADMALSRFPVTHVVSDIQFTSAFGFEGLHFASRAKNGRSHRMILMTGAISEALRIAAPAFGADAILAKPFTLAELEEALLDRRELPDTAAQTIFVPAIDEILASDSLTTFYQPIVQLDAPGRPLGFEALTRARGGWPLGGPAEIFDYAARRSMLGDLNRAMARSALENAMALPGEPTLFVNVDPLALDSGFVERLCLASQTSGFPLSRLVVEITERSNFPDPAAAARVFEALRDEGVRFALDDHGSAYSHLGMIRAIAPSFMKISADFGSAFEDDTFKTRIVQHVVALARDFGAQPILEGIETAATARAARDLGVLLAQGYYFGRPQSANGWSGPSHTAAA